MDVISNIENIPDKPSALLTMGTFDGFHVGHQKVVRRLVEKARESGLKSILVTYAPHPREVISEMSRNPITFISTLEERIKLLSESGLDYIVVHPFTKALAAIEPDAFIRDTVMKYIDVKGFIIGYSHSFGKMRKGTPQYLKELGKNELGFTTEIIEEVRNEDFTINSTNIRRLIGAGDLETVSHYLGRPYHLKGKVINGEKRGKELGFPTLNVLPSSPKKIIPHVGVYCVNIYIQRKNYRGMCNVGYRPTFDGHYLTIEVHVLDAQLKKLYDHEIDVDFIRRIRDEIRFNSREELIQQLEKDKFNCKKM